MYELVVSPRGFARACVFLDGARRDLGELVELDGARHRHPLPEARESDLDQLLRGERAVEVPDREWSGASGDNGIGAEQEILKNQARGQKNSN
jgi:hypothetical protein